MSDLREAAKRVHRGFVRAALAWGVNPDNATLNPIFIRDGLLNYCSDMSHEQEAHRYLRDKGVLEEGFNRAHRLPVPLDRIDEIADAAFERGCDLDMVVQLTLSLLQYLYPVFGGPAGYLSFVLDVSPPSLPSSHYQRSAPVDEMRALAEDLHLLGYVTIVPPEGGVPEHYLWTAKSAPLLKRAHLLPLDIERRDDLKKQIVLDDLSSPETRDLLAFHHRQMHATSPPGTAFALDLSGLQQPGIKVWTLREGDAVLGTGALNALPGGTGELKSMRTHPDHLRKGIARALLEHIVGEASGRGMTRLSLETGTGPDFEPALTLYRQHGFVEGEAFGDYAAIAGSGFNRFFHLDLTSA